jgi:hypothetical protein
MMLTFNKSRTQSVLHFGVAKPEKDLLICSLQSNVPLNLDQSSMPGEQARPSNSRPVRLAYQPPASSTFLSEQTSHQQPANTIFHSEQISTSNQPPAKRTGFQLEEQLLFFFKIKTLFKAKKTIRSFIHHSHLIQF